ncbi:protein of avirulence locus [Vibrio alginolyticus]|nr:protein of avirulence locus [Vibrio alginolyticus]
MTQWKDALSQGHLQTSLDLIIKDVKSSPKDAGLRSSFIELLCISGDFERADDQLMQSIKLYPEYIAGASQLRHLVKAAQARKDFALGAATATVLGSREDSMKSLVALNLAMTNNDFNLASQHSQSLENSRTVKGFTVNETIYSDVRDIDDRLGGYIELFSSAGNYFLVPLADVSYLEMKPANSLLESIWRPVEFDIDGLGEGEGHMPLTYSDSETDAQKLGRETDWKQLGSEDVYAGLGQKCWLVGEMALPLFDIHTLAVTKELA